jgi:hypothetical protein
VEVANARSQEVASVFQHFKGYRIDSLGVAEEGVEEYTKVSNSEMLCIIHIYNRQLPCTGYLQYFDIYC